MTATATADDGVQRVTELGTASWIGAKASFSRALAFITAVGAVWRLGYLIFAKADEMLRLNAGLYYSTQAGLNAEGQWFEDGLTEQPGAEHGMMTSLYLTPWSLGSSDGVFRQRFALTLLGIATITVVGLTGRRLATALAGPTFTEGRGTAERVGLIAAAIAAVYPNLWIHNAVIMSETIAIFLVSLALVRRDRPSPETDDPLGDPVGCARRPRCAHPQRDLPADTRVCDCLRARCVDDEGDRFGRRSPSSSPA